MLGLPWTQARLKLEEQRSIIKLWQLEGENLATFFIGCRNIFLKLVYPGQLFIAGLHSLGRARKALAGRPAKAVTPTMLVNVEVFINKDNRLTLLEVANQLSIGKAPTYKKHTTMGLMIPKVMKYNLHYGDVWGDVLPPPHGTKTSCSVVK